MSDEEVWRRRFRTFALVRLFGVGTFLFGVFVAMTDVVREGGWPLLGGLLAVAGALDAVLAPRMLRKYWDKR